MFGIGFGELLLIMVVALLVVGPDKLPDLAKSIAKAYNQFRRAGNEFKRTVTDLDLTRTLAGPDDEDTPARGADPAGGADPAKGADSATGATRAKSDDDKGAAR